MEKPDSLKKFIEAHKSAFEDEELNPMVFERINQNLRPKKSQTLRLYRWLSVACALLVAFGIYHFNTSPVQYLVKPAQQEIAATPAGKTVNNAVQQHTQQVVAPKEQVTFKKPLKLVSAVEEEPEVLILKQMADSSSVANRIDGIMRSNQLASVNDAIKAALCTSFSTDPSSMVRLAALEVLAKHQYTLKEYLTAELGKQDDPAIQLELVQLVAPHNTPQINEQLWEIASHKNTLDIVKNQAYYALLNNTSN
jgi:hypothetical protein